jgi:diguanylate cyclase (GGDEF)-like protein
LRFATGWTRRLDLARIEPAVPLILGAHGIATQTLVTGRSLALVPFSAVVLLGLAGLAGWRSPFAVLTRALLVLGVALGVQISEPVLVPAMLQWYYGAVAVYPLLLVPYAAIAVGPIAGGCYVAQVLSGAGKVPLEVAFLRAGVLTALGLVVYAAGRAYRQAHEHAESRRRLAEATSVQLEHAATHDALTGLANRRCFSNRLAAEVLQAEPDRLAVLFCDVDRFKTVNDSLGHAVGDEVLVAVSARLTQLARGDDFVARVGGDEFAVLCPRVEGEAAAQRVAQRILAAFEAPLHVPGDAGREHIVSLSIGIAMLGPGTSDAAALVRAADFALYTAKDRGRKRWACFDNTMAVRARELMILEQALHQALRERELEVVYQPIVSLGERRTIGVEALARWTHEGQPVPPDVFIQLAEETGRIGALGRQVMTRALADLAAWRDGGLNIDYVAVNISALQLRDRDFPNFVSGLLLNYGLSPSMLVLEVTESVVMGDSSEAEDALLALWDMGISLSIDDFGTGHSSLARLRTMPVRELKIDRTFIADVLDDATLTRGVISLAQSLGLHTVAEGVETPEQLEYLRKLGCDAAQGFYLARPVPAPLIAEHELVLPRI